MTLDQVVDRVLDSLGPMARRDAPLGARTTYRVGGSAAVGVEPTDENELLAVSAVLRAIGEGGARPPVLVVGRGSNMLVSDGGFPGIAIFIGEAFSWITIEGTNLMAGGGTSLPVVARRAAQSGLAGLEWAVGIPGSIGGAVRMNAGGHGADMAANLVRTRIVDLDHVTATWRAAADLRLGYRSSNLGAAHVVVSVELRGWEGDRSEAEHKLSEIVRWRRVNQPGGQNAGSVFTNPPGDHAGRLLEEAGLKGMRLGTAEVSPKHANFIQADEGGSAEDVLALMEHARSTVAAQSGVELRTEIRLIGFPGTYPHDMVPSDRRG